MSVLELCSILLILTSAGLSFSTVLSILKDKYTDLYVLLCFVNIVFLCSHFH